MDEGSKQDRGSIGEPRALLHLLSGLAIGGKERVVLDLATRARRRGLDHRLCLFDTPFRDAERDLDPGAVPWTFRARGPGLDVRFARALARLVRAEGFDVVHAHNDTALVYGALAGVLLGRARPRIVATFHTRPGHATRGARWLARLAARRVDGLTAVSEDLASFLRESGWVTRCETLWNGVDLERFAPEGSKDGLRARLGLRADTVVVAHVGRHDPVKRQEDLIAAARRLAGSAPELAFVLVGQGSTTSELERAAAGLGSVRFLPRVDDVPAFLRAADLVVLCSREEAAPRVLLEAMACGRAIVATDVGGCRALLTEPGGETCGVLVPPLAPERLAAALAELAAAPARREELGRRARARASRFPAEAEDERYSALWSGAPIPAFAG